MPEFDSDILLLEALGSGDSKALAYIYKNYRPILIKWICGKGGKEQDAEDVFQDAMLILNEKSKDPEFCLTSKLGTFLFAVCKNLWMKRVRKEKFYVLSDQTELTNDEKEKWKEINDVVSNFEKKEEALNRLEEALQEMGGKCSELLKAFYLEEMTMQDIAKKFGYTNSDNAKTQKYKCLRRLKNIFFESKTQ